MSRKELYENKLQIDHFSDDYIRFEEDFQKISAMDVLLTFLIDDTLRTMVINQKNYFKLNKENAKNGKDHYFYFEVTTGHPNSFRKFTYLIVTGSRIYNREKVSKKN